MYVEILIFYTKLTKENYKNFLIKGGILHKDKEKGRVCSFETDDFELSNGEQRFKIEELEAFWLKY